MGENNADSLRLAMLSSKTQEMMENLHDFLETKGKTRLQLKMGIAQFFADDALAAQISERVTRDGSDTGVASPKIEQLVEHYLVPQVVKRMGGADALSKIAAGTYSEKKRVDPYWLYNENAWVRGLEGVTTKNGPMFGQFGVIDGQGTGRGKTGWGVRLGEIVLARGHAFVTNVKLTGIPEEWDARVAVVSRLSALVRALIAYKKLGLKVYVLLDEALFFFGRQDPSTREVRDFDKFARWIRKLGASLVLITHDYDTDLPEKFKGFVKTRFTKTSLKELLAVILADHYKLRRAVGDVPDAARIRYESESRGAFTMDLDVLELADYLTRQLEANPEADEDELTLRYLDDPAGAMESDPLEVGPEPRGKLSEVERRARYVQDHLGDFTDEAGSIRVTAVMSHFGLNRGPARDVAEIVAQRAGRSLAREKKAAQ